MELRKGQAAKTAALPDRRQLEALAERLAIPVSYEKGEMRGGLCRLGSSWRIIVNADLGLDEQAEVLAESLAYADLDAVYVPPRVREALESLRERRL